MIGVLRSRMFWVCLEVVVCCFLFCCYMLVLMSLFSLGLVYCEKFVGVDDFIRKFIW